MSWSSLVEDKLGAARRSVLRRVSASAPLGLLVRGVLALCAGAALSGVGLPGGSLPLGLALVAALPFGAVSVCALLGAVLELLPPDKMDVMFKDGVKRLRCVC